MAFELQRFTRASMAMNTGALTTVLNPGVTPVIQNGPTLFTYASATDTIAQVGAANYFAVVVDDLAVGDIIVCVGSDASLLYQVSAVDRTANTVAVVSFTPAGSVGTANIDNLAVTTAKIDNLAVTAGKIASDAVTTAKILNNNVTSAKLAVTTVQYAAVAVTAAEFNGMYAAPKLLVAAGGANTLLVLDKVDLLMTYVSANYAAGGVAAVQYDSTANGAGVIASSTLAAATFQAAASTGFLFNGGVVPQTFSTCVNKGLYLSNITGAFTTGDSTFVAHVWYKLVPTV